MKNLKLQSAMEYLMTYGWAILIIAVVMVALFSLGILGGNPLSTACLSLSGYICQTPILHSTTFNVVVGQATGNNWVGVNIFWVAQGTPPTGLTSTLACPVTATNVFTTGIMCAGYGAATATLNTGSTMNAGFLVPAANAVTTGTAYSGQLWATYYLSGSPIMYTAQIATATLKAV